MIEISLPFKERNPVFSCNRSTARNRTINTLNSLKRKNPKMWQSSLDTFAKNLYCASPRFMPVPPPFRGNQQGRAYWILLFSVWHKEKTRIVFDAKAPTDNVCLNDTLLQGPDRNNSLRGIIMRFRGHPYAVKADIANMFHNIRVPDHQLTYLRFFW
mgnify:CR=1 FL=1